MANERGTEGAAGNRAMVSRQALKRRTRRDFLIFGTGALAAAAGFWWLLPEETQQRPFGAGTRSFLDSIESRSRISAKTWARRKEDVLNRTLSFDDDVAEALYSRARMVPTYDRSQVTPNLRNNYDGQTPDPSYIPGWTLQVNGLASRKPEALNIHQLITGFKHYDEVTRLVCVEGWSGIAWWGGIRFAEFIEAFPPASEAKWAKLYSSVNLDADGNSDPYYVSIDLDTARHPQTLLATHQNGLPLTVEHGAPLRLAAPMKLGLKNIKAVTSITYTAAEPADYWNERGYSKYDGV